MNSQKLSKLKFLVRVSLVKNKGTGKVIRYNKELVYKKHIRYNEGPLCKSFRY